MHRVKLYIILQKENTVLLFWALGSDKERTRTQGNQMVCSEHVGNLVSSFFDIWNMLDF